MIKRWCPPHLQTAEWFEYQAALDKHLAEHSVYFLQYGAGGLIKIGTARDIDKRMRDIQALCPLPLTFLGWKLGGVEEEHRLHRLFDDSRAWGEWFRPSDAINDYVGRELNHTGRPALPGPRPVLVRTPHNS